MAINDNATLVVSTGRFYTAPVGTAIPTDLSAPGGLWKDVGHTSLEDVLTFNSEGGEATVLGTLQSPALRTSYSKRVESFQFTLQQWDEDGQKLYFGSNAVVNAGLLQVPTDPTPTECAFLVVFKDKAKMLPIYAPKAEIFRADNIEISDTESLAGLPLKVTPLVNGTNAYSYAIGLLGAV